MAMTVFRYASNRSTRYLRQISLSKTARLFSQQQQFPLDSSVPRLPLCTSCGAIKFTSNGNGDVDGYRNGNGGIPPDAIKGIPKFDTGGQEHDNRKPHKQKKLKSKRTNKREGKGKRKKLKFPNPEVRIKYKIEKARNKESLLIEKIKKYEIPKSPSARIDPERLTSEERFYLKRMGQKFKNYVPVGKRGVFGGVILNMHLHWKKHETVKVICKHCKPGQINQYAEEIARLSGGIVIDIKGEDTIIFYRGKNYVQPKVMSPKDTLSKRKALQKSKLEQSLDSVRRFIAISEKELEIYYRHIALYGNRDAPGTEEPGDHSHFPILQCDFSLAIFDGGTSQETPTISGCELVHVIIGNVVYDGPEYIVILLLPNTYIVKFHQNFISGIDWLKRNVDRSDNLFI